MPKTIFLHQVKTAGKTVEKFLIRKYHDKYRRTTSVFKEESIDNIFSILSSKDRSKIQQLNDAKVISGHFPYGIHELLDEESRYFTLLRDPISRTRSYYAYSLKNEGSKIYEYLHQNEVSFEEFVEMGPREIAKAGVHELHYVLEDGQSKIVAGQDLRIGEDDSRNVLQVAEANIDKHFDFVGVTELFDDAFIEISKMLGFGLFSLYITQNRSKVKIDVSESIKKVILERNPADSALHQKYYTNLENTSNSISHRIAKAYLGIGSSAADLYVKMRT